MLFLVETLNGYLIVTPYRLLIDFMNIFWVEGIVDYMDNMDVVGYNVRDVRDVYDVYEVMNGNIEKTDIPLFLENQEVVIT